MTYKTDYIVVEGLKNTFEREMNSLSIKGYISYGNMNTNVTEKGVLYTQLVSKNTQV